MKKWIFIALALLVCGYYFGRVKNAKCPSITYTDVAGVQHDIGGCDKPAIVGFGVADSTPTARAMYLLSEVRKVYPENRVDVVGFYINGITQEELTRLGEETAAPFTIASAQTSPELLAQLISAFKFGEPGRELYIVDRRGHITAVPIDNIEEPVPQVFLRVQRKLILALPNK